MTREPVITAAGLAALITAIAGAIGLTVSSEVVTAIAGCVALLAPLLLAFLARQHVTPTADPRTVDGTPLIPSLAV